MKAMVTSFLLIFLISFSSGLGINQAEVNDKKITIEGDKETFVTKDAKIRSVMFYSFGVFCFLLAVFFALGKLN